MNIVQYEGNFEQVADELLAIRNRLYTISVFDWASATGASFETVYNDGVLPPSGIPTGGQITQNEMNNAISAINSVIAAIDAASAPIGRIAAYN